MKSEKDGINPAATPSGTGCLEYRTGEFFAGPKLHAPRSHPLDQPVPGPARAVPSNWQSLLHE